MTKKREDRPGPLRVTYQSPLQSLLLSHCTAAGSGTVSSPAGLVTGTIGHFTPVRLAGVWLRLWAHRQLEEALTQSQSNSMPSPGLLEAIQSRAIPVNYPPISECPERDSTPC